MKNYLTFGFDENSDFVVELTIDDEETLLNDLTILQSLFYKYVINDGLRGLIQRCILEELGKYGLTEVQRNFHAWVQQCDAQFATGHSVLNNLNPPEVNDEIY